MNPNADTTHETAQQNASQAKAGPYETAQHCDHGDDPAATALRAQLIDDSDDDDEDEDDDDAGMTMTVFDADPDASGPCSWGGEYLDREVESIDEAREVLAEACSEACGLPDYAAGDRLWALVWDTDGGTTKISAVVSDNDEAVS